MLRFDDRRGCIALLVALAFATSGFAAPPAHAPQDVSPAAMAGDSVTVAVDCEAGAVAVTAPDDSRYTVRVAVVSVDPNGSASRSRTAGPFAGNATVAFDGDGTVFAFVLDASTQGVLAQSVARCPREDAAETAGPNATAEGQPSVTVDCGNGSIEVVAPPDLSYDLQVSFVVVTPTETTTASTRSGPNTGNRTVRFAVFGTITAFVLDAETGEVLAETVADCPRPAPAADAEQ